MRLCKMENLCHLYYYISDINIYFITIAWNRILFVHITQNQEF